MNRKKIIFDFDGVIIDSSNVQKKAFLESYEIVVGGGEAPSITDFFERSGSSLKSIFEQMGLPQSMISVYQKISSDNVHMVHVYSGILKVLETLTDKGYQCALCTGKERERTNEILKHLGLEKYFDIIVCSDDVEYDKPSAESLHKIIDYLGGEQSDYIMVGDSANDILAAKKVPVKSIAVTWGVFLKDVLARCGPSAIVESPSDLIIAIERIFKKSKRFLINDLVIAEDYCNMSCDYCLTDTSKFVNQKSVKQNKLIYHDGSRLKKNIDLVSSSIRDQYQVPILKVSGGEILLVKNIIEFIENESKKYKVIQLLTNGRNLNHTLLKRIKKLGNVCIQISIDHHTMAGNILRTKKQEILEQILVNIESVVKYNIPLEINCVLTNVNTPLIRSFVEYLLQYRGKNVMLMPFPIRGEAREEYLPTEEQLSGIEYIADNYDTYQAISAPKIYLEQLIYFLKAGERQFQCVAPSTSIGTFDTGVVTPCSNYWFQSLGNIIQDEKQTVYNNIDSHKIYHVLWNAQSKISSCKYCYTPWDITNLYYLNKLSLEELCGSPLYSFSGMKDELLKWKASIRKTDYDL